MGDVVERGRRGNVRGEKSNLISIITKESRGYRYRWRNIFSSNGGSYTQTGEGGGANRLFLFLYSLPVATFFLPLCQQFLAERRYFRISVAMIFHCETKRSSADGLHFNQYTSPKRAPRESFPYCTSPLVLFGSR